MTATPKFPPLFPPIGMSLDEAARHINVGVTTFQAMVDDGRMPKPVKVGRRLIWNRYRVNAAFTALEDAAADAADDDWTTAA